MVVSLTCTILFWLVAIQMGPMAHCRSFKTPRARDGRAQEQRSLRLEIRLELRGVFLLLGGPGEKTRPEKYDFVN